MSAPPLGFAAAAFLLELIMRPTKSINLNDCAPHSAILADGTAVSVRRSHAGSISVTKGREEIASATILHGKLINLRVHPFFTTRGIGDLLNRSLKRAAGGLP